mgnify:CR=1 FL=1
MPISHISQKTIPKHEVVRGEDIRKEIVELIKKDFPNYGGFTDSHFFEPG